MANKIEALSPSVKSSYQAEQWQMGEHELVCVEKWQETHDVISYRFQGQQPVKFYFKPGQFITLQLNIEGKDIARSYTISSSPSRPYSIVLTIKRVDEGLVSNYLADTLQVGQVIRAMGPSGVFNLVDVTAEKYLFLSAGCGITPMMSMSTWLTDTQVNADINFLHCARSANDLIFDKKLTQLAQRFDSFKLSYVLGSLAEGRNEYVDGEAGHISLAKLQRLASDYMDRTIFVCGPAPFMDAVKVMLEVAGFNMANFHQESFDGGHTVEATVPEAEADGFMLSIGDKQRSMTESETLLEAIEAEGLPIIAACRAGVCGACKCQVTEGEVESTSQIGLSADEIANGFVLACSSKAKSNVAVKL